LLPVVADTGPMIERISSDTIVSLLSISMLLLDAACLKLFH
jgi:hypothetical protein